MKNVVEYNFLDPFEIIIPKQFSFGPMTVLETGQCAPSHLQCSVCAVLQKSVLGMGQTVPSLELSSAIQDVRCFI